MDDKTSAVMRYCSKCTGPLGSVVVYVGEDHFHLECAPGAVAPAPGGGEAVAWQWSDFSGKWYTVDTARMSVSDQEMLARAAAKSHEGRVRPLYAAPDKAAGLGEAKAVWHFDEITMRMAKDLFEVTGRSQGDGEPDVQTRAHIQVYLNNCLTTGALSIHGQTLRASARPEAAGDGWQVVPKKATDEMSDAGFATLPGRHDLCLADVEDIYETMLAAAPSPASTPDAPASIPEPDAEPAPLAPLGKEGTR